jgi:hypothetical protein
MIQITVVHTKKENDELTYRMRVVFFVVVIYDKTKIVFHFVIGEILIDFDMNSH